MDRRGFVKKSAGIPLAAAATALSLEERVLAEKTTHKPARPAPKGSGVPTGKIGNVEISRLICGGNLISGFAHSRDLVYVSSLLKQYFTEEKVLETLALCEANGINTVVTTVDAHTCGLLNKHRENGGKLQWIAQLRSKLEEPMKEAKRAVENGAVGAHLQGTVSRRWLKEKAGVDALHGIVAYLKQNGLIAGCSSHDVATHEACEREQVDLDYYFKTYHKHRYWSARPDEKRHDNMWCEEPDRTREFMGKNPKPWIAFKVLAAGAINPTQGFKDALQSGADFLCVGMFDFQIKHDVQIVKGLFARGIKRERPWRA